ncbi:hypothetical protein LB450_03375 [Psychroflexus sp. CAK1W]|uniref:hypothetical protein n=1 Tax=Psychroflexus curvus TaxID=2873595 RepID=UPI001CCF6189|nr:hypothetical protein [Psychroflexus curvus]MBZ9627136.1 hypothetical protein [Psychroflexus curvus]
MNLKNLNVIELSAQESISIDGGGVGGLLKLLKYGKKYGKKLLEVAGVYDAISDFKEGWNSVDCDCNC